MPDEHMSMMKLTANLRKQIASLGSARKRREAGMFAVEGTRCVTDTLHWFEPLYIVATAEWLDGHRNALRGVGVEPVVAKPDEMARMTSLATSPGVLAVYAIPEREEFKGVKPGELLLALDRVQDPGNLGTIIRIADWFGISRILASSDTVDVYNSKVVQATMGALARVSVIYVPDLASALAEAAETVPVYGTFLDGDDLYACELSRAGVIVMGNEANGISPEVEAAVTSRIKIPSFPAGRPTVESLNVSMATAITVAEFRRRAMM